MVLAVNRGVRQYKNAKFYYTLVQHPWIEG